MPTIRPRYMITETEEVTEALDDAARRWPEMRDKRGELLKRLISEGHAALRTAAEARREAVEQTAGQFTDVFEPGYLKELRGDWPE